MDKGNLFSLAQVSPFFIRALIAAEDARFYEHQGIDLIAIEKSYKANLEAGRVIYGASTITQQVVRQVFLGKERTLLRKAREAFGALVLERILVKDEILTWYINLVYFGFGIYGIADAASFFFETKPELLTLEQAVHLAIVLPSPSNFSKAIKEKALTQKGHKRFSFVLDQLLSKQYITKAQWKHALKVGNFGLAINKSQ
jgi:membrane peptidoglycan carboxypeptidase